MHNIDKTSFANLIKAYNKYLEERVKYNNYIEENTFLEQFREYMFLWNGVGDINPKITLIDRQTFIAAIRAGGAWRRQYKQFINDKRTKDAIIELINYKKAYMRNEITKYQLEGRIVHSKYFSQIKGLNLRGTPKAFISKFIICLCPECFTTTLCEKTL